MNVRKFFRRFFRQSRQNEALLIRELSYLLNAGLPLSETVECIVRKLPKRWQKDQVNIGRQILSGRPLSDTLSELNLISTFPREVLRIGEVSGKLGQCLHELSHDLEDLIVLRRSIIGAFLYPVVVIVLAAIVVGLLVTTIFPKIIPILKSVKGTLPFSTNIMMFTSDLLKAHGILIGTSIIFTLIFFVILRKKVQRVKAFSDGVLIRIPVCGYMIVAFTLSRSTKMIHMLLESGMSFHDSLLIASRAISHESYRRIYEKASIAVEAGKSFSEEIKGEEKLFPYLSTSIIRVGEQSGKLSNALLHVSDVYRRESGERAKDMAKMIEPALMLLIGLMVGFVALSIVTPIYEITSHVGR